MNFAKCLRKPFFHTSGSEFDELINHSKYTIRSGVILTRSIESNLAFAQLILLKLLVQNSKKRATNKFWKTLVYISLRYVQNENLYMLMQ